jgi:hypothetical protein
MQVIPLHDEIATVLTLNITEGELGYRLQQTERDILVMLYNGFLADPVECGHLAFLYCKSDKRCLYRNQIFRHGIPKAIYKGVREQAAMACRKKRQTIRLAMVGRA